MWTRSSQVQCTRPDCRKWRQLTKEIQLTAALAATYRCGMKFNNIKVKKQEVEKRWAHWGVWFLMRWCCLMVHRLKVQTSAPSLRTW